MKSTVCPEYKLTMQTLEQFDAAYERLLPLVRKYPEAKGFMATSAQANVVMWLPPLSGVTERGLAIHQDEMAKAERDTQELMAQLEPYY